MEKNPTFLLGILCHRPTNNFFDVLINDVQRGRKSRARYEILSEIVVFFQILVHVDIQGTPSPTLGRRSLTFC